MSEENVTERLEYLRSQIRAECISYGEISELESLAEYIGPNDTELLQWANVPEFRSELPMPGDILDYRTVIASTYLIDIPNRPALALVLLLNPQPPFYAVAQIRENEAHADGWDRLWSEEYSHISGATTAYSDCGGDV